MHCNPKLPGFSEKSVACVTEQTGVAAEPNTHLQINAYLAFTRLYAVAITAAVPGLGLQGCLWAPGDSCV
jgi:hypothetical protein